MNWPDFIAGYFVGTCLMWVAHIAEGYARAYLDSVYAKETEDK